MSFCMRIGFILSITLVNVTSQKCGDGLYWFFPSIIYNFSDALLFQALIVDKVAIIGVVVVRMENRSDVLM